MRCSTAMLSMLFCFSTAPRLQAEKFHDPGYLLLKSADVTFRNKGKTFKATIRYPEVRHWDLRNARDLMRMYFRIIDENDPGRIHWVHLSQMKRADFRWVVPGPPKKGRGRADHQSSRRRHPERKTEMAVHLLNGNVIKGWSPKAVEIKGLGNRGRPAYDTCGNSLGPPEDHRFYLVSFTPTTFCLLDSGSHGLHNRIETPKYESLVVKDWRDSGIRGESSGMGTAKDLSLREASALYAKYRSPTKPWKLTEGRAAKQVDLCKINHRYTTSKNRSGRLLLGGYYAISDYERADSWNSIEFTGKPQSVKPGDPRLSAVATITTSDGSKTTVLPLMGNPEHDYVGMWKAEYGFAGVSIFPLRKVSLRRTE